MTSKEENKKLSNTKNNFHALETFLCSSYDRCSTKKKEKIKNIVRSFRRLIYIKRMN